MYEFWDPVVKPLLSTVKPRTVVEVGAETGEHTRRLIEWIGGRRGTLHVIDPAPLFDVEALTEAHPSSFVMHTTLSLKVLASIRDPDMVLLDGDHNWYTVIEELRTLARSSSRWPVTLLHDVDWPYGRRDMYYHPDTIPDEFRQPYRFSGMLPQVSALTSRGANVEYANADHEGGPRNGILTAVEDFLDESRDRLHIFCVRGPAGLGLLLDERALKGKVGRVVERVHDQKYALELSPRYASRYFD